MAIKTLINGNISDKLSIQDRGLQYGDGLFETISLFKNNLLCIEEHMSRLEKGCDILKLAFPGIDLLLEELNQLINKQEHGVVKIILTRGEGGRGYQVPAKTSVNRIMSLYDWPEYPEAYFTDGIRVRTCEFRYSQNPALAGIKHLNRIEQVMARSEWSDDSFTEGLVMNREGHVIEGTMSNLFIAKNDVLYTPDLSESGIDGVIRNKIFDHLKDAYEIKIKNLTMEDVINADEAFICNSILGICSIKSINDKDYKIMKLANHARKILEEKGCITKP